MEMDMDEHDNNNTEQQPQQRSPSSASDVPQDYRPRGSGHSLARMHHSNHSRQHYASWSGKSKPKVPPERERGLHHHHPIGAAVSYHDEEGNSVWTNQKDLQTSKMVSRAPSSSSSLPFVVADDNAGGSSPLSLPFAYSLPLPFYSKDDDGDSVPNLEKSNASTDEQDVGDRSSPSVQSIAGHRESASYCGERQRIVMGASASIMASSSPVLDDDEHSITNTNCVPVMGRIADLTDIDSHSENDANDDDVNDDDNDDEEGGIVILDEATEEEYTESMREFSKDNEAKKRQLLEPSQFASNSTTARCNKEEECPMESIVKMPSMMYEADSVGYTSAVRINNANPTTLDNGSASLDFEQLLQEADDQSVAEHDAFPGIGEEAEEANTGEGADDTRKGSGLHFWRSRNPFASLSKQTETSRPRPPPRTSVRATRIRHDKYVVEIDVFPSDASNSRLDTRDAMDIMANMELLHLWFDPVPAVFDANIKDGSGNNITSTPPPVANNSRQYDGQWVEISTSPLTIPSDSRISGYLRALRVGFRSLIGFPSRIRSMIFVERSCGRIGMTLGPYPDGFLCNSGTMAYHTFTIRMSDDEESSSIDNVGNNNGRHVVISDEVRLQRGGNDDDGVFDGTRRRRSRLCCIGSMFHFLFGLLEWALYWYQPDLTSYMQQTISSMNNLRVLVERGESAAYAGGELIMDGNDWEGENVDGTMGAPLLG
eukprot:CAMPEP_0201666986 /NCGR_PEP_ID=MMETSP0494-20130426/10665_1 /ASSEMBLY_ACC=CAM_ASM_000839 /TAXON_ID=420259 /ORGANISM="Thalassiosira gravida, Strain GMp14c1" /LENGTH=712 /DNA_ID=CAMNT_0048146571 /DNA_START=435 /DNA_END=2573 /DNA_ORIENTATION=-